MFMKTAWSAVGAEGGRNHATIHHVCCTIRCPESRGNLSRPIPRPSARSRSASERAQ